MKPWTGRQICNVPGRGRVSMTYSEYMTALAKYRAPIVPTSLAAATLAVGPL